MRQKTCTCSGWTRAYWGKGGGRWFPRRAESAGVLFCDRFCHYTAHPIVSWVDCMNELAHRNVACSGLLLWLSWTKAIKSSSPCSLEDRCIKYLNSLSCIIFYSVDWFLFRTFHICASISIIPTITNCSYNYDKMCLDQHHPYYHQVQLQFVVEKQRFVIF